MLAKKRQQALPELVRNLFFPELPRHPNRAAVRADEGHTLLTICQMRLQGLGRGAVELLVEVLREQFYDIPAAKHQLYLQRGL